MISIRPAYRPGKVPHPTPAVIAPVALFTAVLIAVFGAAYQLETGSTGNAVTPRMGAPAVSGPAQATRARAPAPTRTAPPAHPEQRTAAGVSHASA